MSKKQVVVIGSGLSGLAAATYLASKACSYSVTILEKNSSPGGRARQFESQGFVFDMGPSWYWMPDVFEKYFSFFGKKSSDYYELIRLDPSYSVIFGQNDVVDIPAKLDELEKVLEDIEPGSGPKLNRFLEQAKFNYEVGMTYLAQQPSLSILEFLSPSLLISIVGTKIYRSMSKHVRSHFTSEKIARLLEFPVLFLGETAENIPAIYSLMNYADIVLGTWYPRGGMHEIVKAMVSLAEEKGVRVRYCSEVGAIEIEDGRVKRVRLTSGESVDADVVVASADYHHVDSVLLEPRYRNYDEEYWNRRTMAPSCLIFYLGVNKRLENLRHHNLFFDQDLGPHADAIYNNPGWPEKPLFYVSVPSITDPTVTPEGSENLFVLIPLATNLDDTQDIREKYYDIVMDRLEKLTKQEIRPHVVYKRSYAHNDFKADYHAYKGNAYGLANTLSQSAVFKPRLKSSNVYNLYYTGQLTVPGPGVPACLISGKLTAQQVIKDHA